MTSPDALLAELSGLKKAQLMALMKEQTEVKM
jgi:hypothetical protein